jgi:oxygen-independent coproporphyrinogen III oxidase
MQDVGFSLTVASRRTVMDGTQFCYPPSEQFTQALGGAYVESWISACHEPYWPRPATLRVLAPERPQLIGKQSGRDLADDLLRAGQLQHEMALFTRTRGAPASVIDVYWSAGVTALAEQALRAVHASVTDCFEVEAGARFTASLASGSPQPAVLSTLREFGVTTLHTSTLSTRTHHRAALLEEFVADARNAGFRSISVDLPIDRPTVSARTVREWLAAVSACRPSRVFLIRGSDGQGIRALSGASDPDSWLHRLWCETYATLIASGYEHIAHDAFALSSDEFVKAKRMATLAPTPCGYSICPSQVSIAIGQGAIGNSGPMQYQNARDSTLYATLLGRASLPVERGLLTTRDDLVRRTVIANLLTDFAVDIKLIEASYAIDFRAAFRRELVALGRFEREGIVENDGKQLRLTAVGRFACGLVADVFDRYA